MPIKKSLKKIRKTKVKKQTKKVIRKNSAEAKTLTLASLKKVEEKNKNCRDYSPEEWIKKEAKRIEQEFKKYAPDLEPNSGKSAEECACTAMTLAHHGTKKAIKALEKFKKDPRAPMWIDCGIEECEMILWEDTIGRQIEKAEEKLKKAAEKVFAEKLAWDKEIIINALKKELADQKIKFTHGKTVKLYYKNKIVGEDKTEFIIDDVLLVSIKPSFTEWIMRFKNGLEGKDLEKGDLEDIEQGMLCDEKGEELENPKSLQNSFDEFYENYFYSLLKMSKNPEGILLDFSGDKLYGKYFNLPLKTEATGDTMNRGNCSGWCEGCFEELKCETAVEQREEQDKRRYRVLKRLMKERIEIEEKIEATKRPSLDLEYQIEIAEKIRNNIQEKIKIEKDKKKIKKLEKDSEKWKYEIIGLQTVLGFEQPNQEDWERLETLKETYQAVKEELETEEYKNDTEGLEVYYSKAEPSSKENAACYHDPSCKCDELEPLSVEEKMYEYQDKNENNKNWVDEIPVEEIPF